MENKCVICGNDSGYELGLCEDCWKLWYYTWLFKDNQYVNYDYLDQEEERYFERIKNEETLEIEVKYPNKKIIYRGKVI